MVVSLLTQRQLEGVNWHLSMVMRYILHLCSSLESITFTRIPREWNGVVDCLAKWALEHVQNWHYVDKR